MKCAGARTAEDCQGGNRVSYLLPPLLPLALGQLRSYCAIPLVWLGTQTSGAACCCKAARWLCLSAVLPEILEFSLLPEFIL